MIQPASFDDIIASVQVDPEGFSTDGTVQAVKEGPTRIAAEFGVDATKVLYTPAQDFFNASPGYGSVAFHRGLFH